MTEQRIQNQWSGSREHGVLVPECEQGADPPSLSTFASDLDCEPNQGLKNLGIMIGYLAKNTLKHPSTPRLE
jgi:hypothetical protein